MPVARDLSDEFRLRPGQGPVPDGHAALRVRGGRYGEAVPPAPETPRPPANRTARHRVSLGPGAPRGRGIVVFLQRARHPEDPARRRHGKAPQARAPHPRRGLSSRPHLPERGLDRRPAVLPRRRGPGHRVAPRHGFLVHAERAAPASRQQRLREPHDCQQPGRARERARPGALSAREDGRDPERTRSRPLQRARSSAWWRISTRGSAIWIW
jgi:hypothetical protein